MFSTAAVIGAGVMGTGIARHLAAHVDKVYLVDINEQQIAAARANTRDFNIECSTSFDKLNEADYIIEAVLEDLSIKHQVLRRVSNSCRPETVIATNTSSLLVSDLAGAVTAPQRFLGVHYNNPADMNPVVEIIPGPDTPASQTSEVYAWMKSTGKLAITCADTSGFILNRQSLPYINEAARCLDIATPGEIDCVAINELGVGLGPFAVMNLVGLPVMAAASNNLSVLGTGYGAAGSLQERAGAENPTWAIKPIDSVAEALTTSIRDRLLGAQIYPGQDILSQSLCARDDLHMICMEALGYARSSPQLLEQLSEQEVARLVSAFLKDETG